MLDFLTAFLPELNNDSAVWLYSMTTLVSALESLAFVGLIVPGTTLVIAAGILSSHGVLNVAALIWCVALGGILGDTASFFAGRRGIGLFRESNRFFKPEYLRRGEQFFVRHGDKSVFFARFIGPIRPVIPFVAGLVKMPAKKFFLFNLASAAISAPAYVLFGYFFGSAWERVRHFSGWVEVGFLVAVVFAATLLIGRKEKKILNKVPPPGGQGK